MNIEILKSPVFTMATQSYLTAAFWAQTLPEEERKGTAESLDDLYDHADCHETVHSYIAGECAEIFYKLRKDGVDVGELSDNDIDSLFFGLGGSATGTGMCIRDRRYEELSKSYVKTLAEWYYEKRGKYTLNMYPGDDKKVYIEGHEHKKTVAVTASLSKREGCFGALYPFTGEAVTAAALLYEQLKLLSDVEHFEKRWLLCYK